MTKSAKSVFYFGIYLVLTGLLLCFIPVKFVSLFMLPEIPLGWARILGLLVMILGGYYAIAGRNNLVPFIKGTIYLRIFFLFGVIVLFASGEMPKEILPFGVIDLLGALWTMFALKSESR